MGRQRQVLPPVPLFILSEQQRKVYNLAENHSTGEIAEILSLPEKQVRQVYTAIRHKSREYANKYVPPGNGDESDHFYPLTYEALSRSSDFYTDLMENNGYLNLTASELFVLEQVRKGISIREISRLTGKTVVATRKTHQRLKKKISKKNGLFEDNCITKIDTGKTLVKINLGLLKQAAARLNLDRDQLSSSTGIPIERIEEIEKDGILNYDELFALINTLGFNPYGPSEKDLLAQKLADPGWINAVRTGKAPDGHRKCVSGRNGREKARYRNRVMYYATACYRYNGCDRERPLIEYGRNGFFPLTLTREQQSRCRWLLKRLMLKPVFTYRHSGLDQEIKSLEENNTAYLKNDLLQENGRSIYLVNKFQMTAIKHALFFAP
ncbi:MAG: helix-turn-helix transcriptional regulator [Bacillota bacterium]